MAAVKVSWLWESTGMVHREMEDSQLMGRVSSGEACLDSCFPYYKAKRTLNVNICLHQIYSESPKDTDYHEKQNKQEEKEDPLPELSRNFLDSFWLYSSVLIAMMTFKYVI